MLDPPPGASADCRRARVRRARTCRGIRARPRGAWRRLHMYALRYNMPGIRRRELVDHSSQQRVTSLLLHAVHVWTMFF